MASTNKMGVPMTENVETVQVARSSLRIHKKTIIVVVSICFMYTAQLVSLIGAGVLAQTTTALLGGEDKTTWFTATLTIATVALNPVTSQAADYWGRKWFVIASSLCGIAGSIVVSRAQNITTLIVGFCIIGGSYASQSLLFAIVSEVLPRRVRPLGQSIFMATSGMGGVIAIVAGGCLKLQRLDWVGYVLFSPGLILFSVGLAWSLNPYSWNNAHVLASFIVGVGLMIGFGFYEWRIRKDGLLHHELFKRNFLLALLIIGVEGLVFFTSNAYLVFQITVFYQEDLLTAGLPFVILFVSTAIFSAFWAAYSTKVKSVKIPLILGCVFLTLFNIVMATVKPTTPRNVLWGYPLFAGAGLGAILPLVMVAGQLSTTAELIALASGLIIAVRCVGASIGLAVNNAIFNSSLTKDLAKVAGAVLPLGFPPENLAALIGAILSGYRKAIAAVPGATPEIIGAAGEVITAAYATAFQHVWIAAACFSSLSIIAAIFLKEAPEEFSKHIDAPAEVELTKIQEEEEEAHSNLESVERQ